jgi:hypothetical protein
MEGRTYSEDVKRLVNILMMGQVTIENYERDLVKLSDYNKKE